MPCKSKNISSICVELNLQVGIIRKYYRHWHLLQNLQINCPIIVFRICGFVCVIYICIGTVIGDKVNI